MSEHVHVFALQIQIPFELLKLILKLGHFQDENSLQHPKGEFHLELAYQQN